MLSNFQSASIPRRTHTSREQILRLKLWEFHCHFIKVNLISRWTQLYKLVLNFCSYFIFLHPQFLIRYHERYGRFIQSSSLKTTICYKQFVKGQLFKILVMYVFDVVFDHCFLLGGMTKSSYFLTMCLLLKSMLRS